MRNRFRVESERGESVPHELTVARLEVMRTAVRPQIDRIEAIVQMFVEEEPHPDLEDEMEVVFIGVGGTEEIKVTADDGIVRITILHDDDAILNDGTSSRFICQWGRGEVHQYK